MNSSAPGIMCSSWTSTPSMSIRYDHCAAWGLGVSVGSGDAIGAVTRSSSLTRDCCGPRSACVQHHLGGLDREVDLGPRRELHLGNGGRRDVYRDLWGNGGPKPNSGGARLYGSDLGPPVVSRTPTGRIAEHRHGRRPEDRPSGGSG